MNENHHHAEIATGLKAGSAEAWQALFDEFAPRVWQYTANRMLGPAAANVPDVVQETMLAAAKSAAKFDPDRGSIWSWLTGIASNQIALHFRQAARQDLLNRAANELQHGSGGRLARWFEQTELQPIAQQSQAETSDLVQQALTKLPPEYAQLLVAKYLDQQTIQEIADSQNTSVASVNSKLARARQSFRSQFSPTH